MSTATPDLVLTHSPRVDVGMLVRRPSHDAFQAFVDPAIMTRIWYTKSTGIMTAGADLRWEWAMYDFSSRVVVTEVEEDRRIVFLWGEDNPTTVAIRFLPMDNDTTFIQIIETGHSGNGDAIAAHATASTEGFTIVLCALKALLEHDIVLSAVRDRFPPGLEL